MSLFGTPTRAPAAITSVSPDAKKRNKSQLHIIHTLNKKSYLVFKDRDDDIKNGFLSVPLPASDDHPDGPKQPNGMPLNRCRGTLLTWRVIPQWNCQMIWCWQDANVLGSELVEFLTSLEAFDDFTITESSGVPEVCMLKTDALQLLLGDRAVEKGVDSPGDLVTTDKTWLGQIFGPTADFAAAIDDATGCRKRKFAAASDAGSNWRKRRDAASPPASE
jgi:hypothetical protein